MDMEAARIAKFLGITDEEFVARYCSKKGGKLSIICSDDLYCIFYNKDEGCSIHPVKPERCRDWPYYESILRDPESWEEAKDACPGISRECTFQEFKSQAAK